MNNENFYIGLYWNNDKSNKSIIKNKILQTISELGHFKTGLKNWYSTRKPQKGADIPKLNEETFDYFFESAKLEDDHGNHLENLGFKFYLTSDLNFGKANVLSISCGLNDSIVPNSIVLDLKIDKYDQELLKIFIKLINIWNPEFGLINSPKFFNLTDKLARGDKEVGIVTFFRSYSEILDLDVLEVKKIDKGYLSFIKNSNISNFSKK
ncbi:Imm52 family immunity protein [Christiangramia sp. SM2212]|uniref:Immunity protein 52 domain-containing protein n=1 Tax=Christiangramia sediminicola TaxID=3073267 RepID=A0ABU1ETE3_9FLAO|nr:Imm52 family immunity protein [Christiangramia sp. SM2212]MDR5591663.1 hypothetical protein [Christiangramia sp. SM2212]